MSLLSELKASYKEGFHGWAWFLLAMFMNFMLFSIPVFDGGFTNAVNDYFSTPYAVTALLIAVHRGNRITVIDFFFLMFGNFFITTFLWILINPKPY